MTTLTRWDPVNTLAKFQDEMTRMFDEPVFRGFRTPTSLTIWTPAVDIFETEHEIVLKAELPDIDEKDIDVRVEKNTLTLSGERKFEKEFKEENALRMERYYGTFSRTFTLPNIVKLDAVKAEYRNGVLTVKLPKLEEAKPKQIKIAVGNGK
ncbi:MAG TPA: Hsp20/alpha crystallin family protein [Candidatus Acidoferrales bacterium]|nr:Hsp20/alpha crystallin family protein [Candidatus Acidoferrales bacterium]